MKRKGKSWNQKRKIEKGTHNQQESMSHLVQKLNITVTEYRQSGEMETAVPVFRKPAFRKMVSITTIWGSSAQNRLWCDCTR